MANIDHLYPTEAHKNACVAVVDFFSQEAIVRSVVLTCSCARGKATKDSCLDISIITDHKADLKQINGLQRRWGKYYHDEPVFDRLKSTGKYSTVDLEITSGIIIENPDEHNWTSGPDTFELAIGNLYVYSVPLYGDSYWASLKSSW